jgi:glycosyltransferase involved in cell wall biosynthesis
MPRLVRTSAAVPVLQLQRQPTAAFFSIEGYFERVRTALCRRVTLSVFLLPRISRGLWPRLLNLWAAWQQRAALCHVTGDVHYVCLVLKRSHCLLTVHDCQILHRLQGWRRAVLKLFWYTLPVRNAARITVNSAETKRQLLREVQYPPERIHVIPVSVSELFQPDSRDFNTQCPRILQIGTKANKNVPRLLQALQGLNCHLDIVGPVSDQLQELLDGSGVPWTGWGRLSDQQLLERYRQADVVAFVSTEEGFGMPIVEAQWVERVCVTSNCSSMPEVAGDAACLVDPFDVQSIRAGFQRVFSDADLRDTLIARGRINRQRFDAGRIAEQFLEVYRLLAADGGYSLAEPQTDTTTGSS